MGFLSIGLRDYRNIASAASAVWRGDGDTPRARDIAAAITSQSDGSMDGDFKAGATAVQALGAQVINHLREAHGGDYVDKLLERLRS